MKRFVEMRGGINTQGLYDLVMFINQFQSSKEMSMIEIGSYTGESSVVFAETFGKVICIDPFIDGYDPEDGACAEDAAPFDDVYKEFLRRTSEYKNLSNIKMTSDEAFNTLAGQKFDFVYIDGAHTYDQVSKDIKNYKTLINPGGFIGGHDYYEPRWPDLVKAIHENFQPDAIFVDASWIKKL